MPWVIPAVAAAGSIASSAIGASQAAADRDAAERARQQAIQQWLSINVPDPEQQKIALQHYKRTGSLTPELENALQQDKTELGGIILDPTSRAAQLSALSKMQELAASGGMDAQAKLKLQQAIDDANSNEKAQRDAIVQDYARRGMGGSGAQLQAQLLASQSASNRAAQVGAQAAADAEMRALQALMNSSGMANQLRSQDYNEQARAAEAQDAINAFNTRNSQSVSARNIDRTNDARKYNLGEDQRIADANVDLSNKEHVYNKELQQKQFENRVKIAAGASGQYAGAAAGHDASADRTANTWSGVGNAISTMGGAYGQYANRQKKDDEEV